MMRLTRTGRILYLSISLGLAMIAASLHVILLYPVFLVLDITAYYIIKFFFKKEDDEDPGDKK